MKTIQFFFVASGLLLALSCKKETAVDNAKTDPVIPGSSDTVYHLSKSALLQLVNDVRKTGCTCGSTTMPAVPALTWNNDLAKAADEHSEDMLVKNYFSHTGSDGSSPGDRITATGYIWQAYGENIAFGYADEKSVMSGWLGSEGHCMNIMSASVQEMGAAREGKYWTQDFGSK